MVGAENAPRNNREAFLGLGIGFVEVIQRTTKSFT